MEETILTLVKILAGSVSTFVPLFLKLRADSKKRKIAEDEKQNTILKMFEVRFETSDKRIENIEITQSRIENTVSEVKADMTETKKNVKELNTLHKYTRFNITLMQELFERVSNLTLSSNKEIRQLLIAGFDKIMPVIKEILDTDFKNINHIALFEKLKIQAKELRNNINPSNLNLDKDRLLAFNRELKSKLILLFNTFAVEVETLSKKEDRSDKFQDECKNFVDQVVKLTEESYQKQINRTD